MSTSDFQPMAGKHPLPPESEVVEADGEVHDFSDRGGAGLSKVQNSLYSTIQGGDVHDFSDHSRGDASKVENPSYATLEVDHSIQNAPPSGSINPGFHEGSVDFQ